MRTATCQCGQLSIAVEGEPAMVTACSCTRCQRRSGSAFSLSSRWNSEQVINRLGDSSIFTRKGASGGNVHCVFCPRCGSTVSTSLELFPGLIGIGGLAENAAPERHRGAATARNGQCSAALETVHHVGDPVASLPFTAKGLGPFLASEASKQTVNEIQAVCR